MTIRVVKTPEKPNCQTLISDKNRRQTVKLRLGLLKVGICFLVLIALIHSISAQQNIDYSKGLIVSKAKVYRIFYYSYFESENFTQNDFQFFYNQYTGYYQDKGPRRDFVDFINCPEINFDLSQRIIEKFLREKKDSLNCSYIVSQESICNIDFLECFRNNVRITYDGYFLIGSADVEVSNTSNLSSILPSVYTSLRGLENEIDYKTKLINLSTPPENVIEILFLPDVSPSKLTNGYQQNYYELSIVPPEYTSGWLKNESYDFLRYNSNLDLQVVEYKSDSNQFFYFIRNKKYDRTDFGKLIVIVNTGDLEYDTLMLSHMFTALSYLRYENRYIEPFVEVLKNDSSLFLSSIKDSKKRILFTNISSIEGRDAIGEIDISEKVTYLENLRGSIIDDYLNQYENITYRLNFLKKLRNDIEGGLEYPKWHNIGFLVFSDRINVLSDHLNTQILEIETNLQSAEKNQEEVRQLYYSELESARSKQSIKISHNDTLASIKSSESATKSSVRWTVLLALLLFILERLWERYRDFSREYEKKQRVFKAVLSELDFVSNNSRHKKSLLMEVYRNDPNKKNILKIVEYLSEEENIDYFISSGWITRDKKDEWIKLKENYELFCKNLEFFEDESIKYCGSVFQDDKYHLFYNEFYDTLDKVRVGYNLKYKKDWEIDDYFRLKPTFIFYQIPKINLEKYIGEIYSDEKYLVDYSIQLIKQIDVINNYCNLATPSAYDSIRYTPASSTHFKARFFYFYLFGVFKYLQHLDYFTYHLTNTIIKESKKYSESKKYWLKLKKRKEHINLQEYIKNELPSLNENIVFYNANKKYFEHIDRELKDRKTH